MPYTNYPLLLSECTISVAVIEGSARSSVSNRYPIVVILCLISVEILFNNRLSKVSLLLGIDTRPQANASLWLY